MAKAKASPQDAPLDAEQPGTAADTPQPADQPEPTGPAVELHYTGDPDTGEPHIEGVWATDLTGPQIDHLVYARTVDNRDGVPGLVPGDEGFGEARADVVKDLVASGLYEEE